MSTSRIFQPWRDTPVLSSSMEDFESAAALPSPSHTPSSRQLDLFDSPAVSAYSDVSDDLLQHSWSPSITPAWRKQATGLYHKAATLTSPTASRQPSPELHRDELEDADEYDGVTAAEIPLPGSPTKGRSISRSISPPRDSASPERGSRKPPDDAETERRSETPARSERAGNNYIRFTVRADVQHRTEPIESAISSVRNAMTSFTKTPFTAGMMLLGMFMLFSVTRSLFVRPAHGPAPDLIKAAGLARAFEPLMYYSENGHTQVVQLGDTGIAVWDLCESVKFSNMTSGPIIVKELDELSDSLKLLALELTRFFANIDGDIDSILLVMEWAQRELARVSSLPETTTSVVFANVHAALSRAGILEDAADGTQTAVGKMVQGLFGSTVPQVQRSTLQRTFMEFLSVLEESINNELTASMSLFAHFEAIDRKFHNLQRTVIRETDAQEREESEVLASLWTRMIGGSAGRLRKFERNKQLLLSLRERTVKNKHVIVDHNGRLLQLRSNLEILRKKLVSPLVRSNVSSTMSIEEQLVGLEGTYASLRTTREAQKQRLYNLIHAGSMGGARTTLSAAEDGRRIESR